MSHTAAVAYSAPEILAALQGAIPPVRLSALYKIGLLLVAVVMVLLPLIYIAMIAGVGYGVYYHAMRHTGIISNIWTLVFYLAPIVAGAVLIVFMFKPLFAARPPMLLARQLARTEAPRLFEFVSRTCQIIGAPAPKEICVNFDVNAYASFRRGFLSFWGNDLSLTVGLPLIKAMNLRQFAGILAHEFGHFAQGTAMRFTFLIRSINLWFARVVFERDAWDLKLVQYSEEADFRVAAMLLLARGSIWVSRKILFGLMWFGNMVSAFMLRQMEFDADRYEIELSGSDNFVSTVHRLRQLQAANQIVLAEVAAAWHEKRLPQDMIAMVMAKANQLPDQVHAMLNNSLAAEKTGIFDSHPCDRDRIENARKENANGIFHSDLAAATLFDNLDALSQELSRNYYKNALGSMFTEEAIVPTKELMQRQATLNVEQEATVRYFCGMPWAWRPAGIWNENLRDSRPVEELLAELRQSRETITPQVERLGKIFEQFGAAQEDRLKTLQIIALLQIEAKVKLEIKTLDEAETRLKALEQQAESLKPQLDDFDVLQQQRLVAALRLLHSEGFSSKIPSAASWQAEIGRLMPALQVFVEQRDAFKQIRDHFLIIDILARFLESARDQEFAQRKAGRLIPELHQKLLSAYKAFAEIEYPFEHKERRLSIAKFLRESEAPLSSEFSELYAAGMEFVEKSPALYSRILGRIAAIAEKVEETAGFSPIPVEDGQHNAQQSELKINKQ